MKTDVLRTWQKQPAPRVVVHTDIHGNTTIKELSYEPIWTDDTPRWTPPSRDPYHLKRWSAVRGKLDALS